MADALQMPFNILECPVKPCPCPVSELSEGVIEKASIIPVGSFIGSPGGLYVYEIISEPILRKYLDFKGLFEKPVSTKRVTKEMDSMENLNEVFVIRSFFSAYRVGTTYKMPSIGRMFWIWLAVMLGKNAPHWYLNTNSPLCPYWKMFHADESDLMHGGKNYFRSYWVKIWFEGDTGWISSKPKIITIRWKPALIDFSKTA